MIRNTSVPPLAQACSLCQIQNSQFSPRPTSPIITRVAHTPCWRELVARV
ncbi:hypothetical protein HMPREF9075_02726 [Capnocytophaga sp. oral taxon 332 str. F0381]|nr:hypothetical protein HMPREF9075_02726 [Capnocytophaga sp. oral taxon 332 str. F0381]